MNGDTPLPYHGYLPHTTTDVHKLFPLLVQEEHAEKNTYTHTLYTAT